MPIKRLSYYEGKRVLLLQGPVGPFFRRLGQDLKGHGALVYKINFNAGDCLFYPRDAISYKGSFQDWPRWLDEYIKKTKIDVVILFGDCRPIHQPIHPIVMKNSVELCVFEEGYWRPNHITFEQYGVNSHSTSIPSNPEFYKQFQAEKIDDEYVGSSYWQMIFYGFIYALFFNLGRPFFNRYQHHRDIGMYQVFPWLRSAIRKIKYAITEKKIGEKILNEYQQQFFLVPLQVENDFQIRVHSDFKTMKDFISVVMQSFAIHAPLNTALVFKHHLMDRGHCNYQAVIDQLSTKYFLNGRVFYLHDERLPSLIDASRGVVVINSTVGLSALIHHKPVKALGRGIYNFAGLTYQGDLDDFWNVDSGDVPSEKFVGQFLGYITKKTQLNGSFYKRLKSSAYHSGLKWNDHPEQD